MATTRITTRGYMVIQGTPVSILNSKFCETEEEADFEAKKILDRDNSLTLPVYVVQVTQHARRRRTSQNSPNGQAAEEKPPKFDPL